ncbi:MAG: serine/threonine-protein kinase [Myxococcota bacterium]
MTELAGRYRLGDVLGTGGTSTVYRATDTTLGVERAVKVLRGEGEGVDAQRARLRAEARAMARVTHPNILRVYDVGTDEGQDFFVMELADGGTLQDRVDAEGPLSPLVVCRYALQVLGALAAAHDAGVIHRDVKPQNVLLDRDGVALLADFGIALLADGRESRHTRVGVAMGSMTYMPPEQRIDARGVGVGADVYATGATLYAVLTGATPVDLFLAPAASARWDDIPAVLRPVLQRATRLAPAGRYPSARDMAAAVVAAMAKLPPGGPAPSVKDEAAWAGVRDRVLASLAGPVSPPEPFDETTSPPSARAGARRTSSAKIAPTMEADSLDFAKAPPRRRIWPALLALSLLFVGIAGAGAGSVWYVLRGPDAPTAGALAAGTAGAAGEGSVEAETARAETVLAEDGESPVDPDATSVVTAPVPATSAPPSDRTKRRVAATEVVRQPGDTVVSPIGAWRGSWNGRDLRFELSGTDDALRGTVVVTYKGNAISSEVQGSYASASRMLELADVVERADSGRYSARLTEEPALEGRFEGATNGRVVPFRVVPVE